MYGDKVVQRMRGAFVVNMKNQVLKDAGSFAMRGSRNFMFAPIIVCLCLAILGADIAFAFEQIQISTGAPAGFEKTFLSAMQAQFNVKITTNPLVANTYSIVAYGPNLIYNPPITNLQLLQQINLDSQYMATVDSFTYVYGFADGQICNQQDNRNIVEGFEINCSTPNANVPTWDPSTCISVTAAIDNAIYQESLSTPTVIGGF